MSRTVNTILTGMNVTLRTWALVAGIGLACSRPMSAQDVPANIGGDRLVVQVQANGNLIVVAANARLDDVIRAVATVADVRVSTIGAPIQNRITVHFSNRTPELILSELLDSAGISYVLVAAGRGQSGRLVMGRPELRTMTSPASAPAPVETATALPPAISAAAAVQPVPARKAGEETEWPVAVEPVNTGVPLNLPTPAEELFRIVNGTSVASVPSDLTPSPAGQRAPSIASVNPIAQDSSFTTRVIASGRDTAASLGAAGSASANAPIDSSMLRPPQVIQLPPTVVVQFPGPPR